jgi:hypothetical protein
MVDITVWEDPPPLRRAGAEVWETYRGAAAQLRTRRGAFGVIYDGEGATRAAIVTQRVKTGAWPFHPRGHYEAVQRIIIVDEVRTWRVFARYLGPPGPDRDRLLAELAAAEQARHD